MVLPCCIARCRVRARSGAPLVVCAVATGYQLWTWPPLGTGAAISCPVVPGVWVIWGSWWHEKRRIGASPARAALIRERAAQSADHLAEKRQKWAVVGEVVCDLGKSRNTANTTTYNSDFPAPHSRQVTTPATRFVQPPSWPQPTKTPTFPHQQAKKSPFQQHVVSYHPNFHPSQINAASPTLSCHNSTRTTGELRATLLGNHANAALRTALRTDRPKNGPSTV